MAHAPIGAVDRLFDIIETIQVRDGAGVSELAEELDMAKSTVHGHLATLKERGYLVQDEASRYHLSLTFLTLGGAVRQVRTIYSHVEPLLAEIASETGESVNYVIESQGKMTFVGSVLGEEGIRTEVDVGFRTDLHTTPEGKLVLAHLPASRRRELLDEIEFPIGNSVGRAAFTAELDEIREAGIAYGNETIVKNVSTVSVPVIDNEDIFYGAIVVAGPSLRFTQDRVESIKETLQYKVGKLNIDLTYETQESVVENRLETQ
ncbi:MAG: IclR family transcriptional regulator [Halodesulfurarchaeum sp.]|nr:IclR family transcriptional regulator [Halodesulfurarchaeum sp.]